MTVNLRALLEEFPMVRGAQTDPGLRRDRLRGIGPGCRCPDHYIEEPDALVLPPAASHSPLGTYFHSVGSLSALA